jgi:hypothetical protein
MYMPLDIKEHSQDKLEREKHSEQFRPTTRRHA